jgi:hypothetical protein
LTLNYIGTILLLGCHGGGEREGGDNFATILANNPSVTQVIASREYTWILNDGDRIETNRNRSGLFGGRPIIPSGDGFVIFREGEAPVGMNRAFPGVGAILEEADNIH